MPRQNDDQYSDETGRLQRILRGAFDGPPTPLKAIPKKNGRDRSSKRAPVKAASSEERARSEN